MHTHTHTHTVDVFHSNNLLCVNQVELLLKLNYNQMFTSNEPTAAAQFGLLRKHKEREKEIQNGETKQFLQQQEGE